MADGAHDQPKKSGRRRANPPDVKDRTVTFRLEPTAEDKLIILQRMSEYRSYANRFVQALRADAIGLRPPEESPVYGKPDPLVQKHERLDHGFLSCHCYVAAETEAKRDWGRKDERGVTGARKYPAGAPIPQYRQDSLGIATISGRPGVRLVDTDDGAIRADLHLNKEDFDGPRRISVLVSRRTWRDEYRWPVLQAFARGELEITYAQVRYKKCFEGGKQFGKWLLTLAYKKKVPLPIGNDRAATICMEKPDEVSGVSRLTVRNGVSHPFDLTHDISVFVRLKANLDGIRRRKGAEIARSRGARRLRRRIFARFDMDLIAKDRFHKLAKRVIGYCLGSGCGQLRVLDLGGGDWPAALFRQYLKTCGENLGVQVVEVRETSALTLGDVKAHERQKKHEREVRKQARNAAQTLGLTGTSGNSGK